MAKELLTNAELMTVLHRQGFETVEEVERCVLEPGGTFDIKGKTPRPDEQSHAEVMRALKDLTAKVDALMKTRGPGLTFIIREAGGMGEWLIPAVLKTVNGETRSGVRIPLPPPPLISGMICKPLVLAERLE